MPTYQITDAQHLADQRLQSLAMRAPAHLRCSGDASRILGRAHHVPPSGEL